MEEQSISRENVEERPLGLQEICFEFMYYLLWCIVFWIGINNTEEINCLEPVWFWAHYAKYFYLTGVVTQIFSLFCLGPFSKTFRHNPKSVFFYIFLVVLTLVRIAAIILVIGMIKSFIHRDWCPDLYTILTVQFIILMTVIGILVIFGCIIGCLAFMNKDKPSHRRTAAISFLRAFFPIFQTCQTKSQFANME